MTQTVRLCVIYAENALCRFTYDPHGTGKLVLNEAYSISSAASSVSLNTGVKFMLVSENPDVDSPGQYYSVIPYLNPALKLQSGVTGVNDPITGIIAYPTGKDGKEMYTLIDSSDKPTLSLRLLLNNSTITGNFQAGSVLCFLTFPVGFDLLNKETCFELT